MTGLRGHPSFSFHPKIPSHPPHRVRSGAPKHKVPASPAQPVLVRSQSWSPPTPQVSSDQQNRSSAVTVPLPVRPLSFRLGLVSGPHAPAVVPVSLNSHTHSRTAPHCYCLVLLVLLLLLPLLGDPSIHPSFPVLGVVPPLFLSLNLFSLFTLVAKITILSLIFGRNHSDSSSSYLPSTRYTLSTRPIPHRRRGASAEPFTSTSSALSRLPVATRTSRSFENFSTRRPQHNLVTCRQGVFGP